MNTAAGTPVGSGVPARSERALGPARAFARPGRLKHRRPVPDGWRANWRAAGDEANGSAYRFGTISITSAFYRAMSLYRQGKQAEAHRVATEAASRMRPLENQPLTGGANADDLILWLAYGEPKVLIGFEATPAPPARSAPKLEKP